MIPKVNGNKKPETEDAEYLTWLRKEMFSFEESNDYAADVNGDFEVNLLDLICLRNLLIA